MNILVIANKVPYPPTDGGAFATLNMVMGLNEAGANVSVLAINTPKHFTRKADIPKQVLSKIDFDIFFIDTSISIIKAIVNLIFSNRPYNAERFFDAGFEALIAQKLLQKNYDIVQLEGSYLFPYIPTIKKLYRGKIALRAHNVEWEIWKRTASLQKNVFKKWYFNNLAKRIFNLEKKILQQTDLLVPISERDSIKLIEMGYDKEMHICPVGYNLFFNSKSVEPRYEFPSVFHIGGLDWLPNQEGIIWFLRNCWPIIVEKFPNVTFYIAGRNAPQTFIEQLNKYANVVFCGEVKSSVDFIESKAVMIVPLLSGSGMRVKIVEGMALGKAIVSTTIGAEGINAINGKQIAIADSPYNFAMALINLLKTKDSINEMGQNAQQFAEINLNNRILTQNLLNFYRRFI
jgi:glycosyltransferase involved in cell wall biosynthesis